MILNSCVCVYCLLFLAGVCTLWLQNHMWLFVTLGEKNTFNLTCNVKMHLFFCHSKYASQSPICDAWRQDLLIDRREKTMAKAKKKKSFRKLNI